MYAYLNHKDREYVYCVVNTEATTSGNTKAMSSIHAFENMMSGYKTQTAVQVDWGDGTITTIPKGIEYSDAYFDEYATHTYATPGEYVIGVTADDLGKCSFTNAIKNMDLWQDTLVGIVPKDPTGYSFPELVPTAFKGAFYGCSKLKAIPAGIFDGNPNTETFNSTFHTCSGLTEIPSGLFDKTVKVNSFSDCFYGCLGIKAIPNNLFDNCPDVTTFLRYILNVRHHHHPVQTFRQEHQSRRLHQHVLWLHLAGFGAHDIIRHQSRSDFVCIDLPKLFELGQSHALHVLQAYESHHRGPSVRQLQEPHGFHSGQSPERHDGTRGCRVSV